MLTIADICGAESILVVPGIVTEETSYADAYSRAVEALQELAEKAEKVNVKIGIENVWNKFLLSPLEFSSFLEEVHSPNVGAYLDIGNLFQNGFPEQWIHCAAGRIVNVHVKDFKQSVGNMEGFVPLLAGDINWDKVKKALQEAGYEGYVAPEIPPHRFHYELQLKQTAEVMRYFFN